MTAVGPMRSRPSTAATGKGPPLTHARSGPLSVLITRTRTGVPGGGVHGRDAGAAGEGPLAAVGVHRRRHVLCVRRSAGRAGRRTCRTSRRAPGRSRPGASGTRTCRRPRRRSGRRASPRADGVLGDPRDAVLGVGDVDAVPVQRHAVGHVDIGQRDLTRSPVRLDRRAGRAAVEGVPLHPLAAGQRERLRARREFDRDVRLPVGRAGQVGDAAADGAVLVRRAAAVVDIAHVHDRVGRGHQAREPVPAQRASATTATTAGTSTRHRRRAGVS